MGLADLFCHGCSERGVDLRVESLTKTGGYLVTILGGLVCLEDLPDLPKQVAISHTSSHP
jgi:hypothetical protein